MKTAISRYFAAVALLGLVIPHAASASGWEPRDAVDESSVVLASWYGPTFHGRLTASGQVFDQERMTAAHKTLPFGTKLRVTNLRNGRSVLVVINDRGPFVRNRQLDLSKGAARRLGLIQRGTGPVLIEKL